MNTSNVLIKIVFPLYLMIKTTSLMSIFVIAGILIGSIAVSSNVFASYDKRDYSDVDNKSSSNGNLYVNSLSFDFDNPDTLDSCDAILPPCILINPRNTADQDQIFIVDTALLNTRTLVAVNVNEHDNFPTSSPPQDFDIFHFPECFTITLANFNGVNGVFLECNAIDSGIIDVTYSFTDPRNDDHEDDDHEDDDHEDDDHEDDDHEDDKSKYD